VRACMYQDCMCMYQESAAHRPACVHAKPKPYFLDATRPPWFPDCARYMSVYASVCMLALARMHSQVWSSLQPSRQSSVACVPLVPQVFRSFLKCFLKCCALSASSVALFAPSASHPPPTPKPVPQYQSLAQTCVLQAGTTRRNTPASLMPSQRGAGSETACAASSNGKSCGSACTDRSTQKSWGHAITVTTALADKTAASVTLSARR